MVVGQEFNPYKMFTGYWVPESIMPYTGITNGAKLCLSVLYRFMGTNEVAWPSQSQLAERMGCSERSIHAYIDELESDGFIKSTRLGLGMTNRYTARWHRIFEETGTPRTATIADQVADLDRKQTADLDRKQASDPSIELKRVIEESHYADAEQNPSSEEQQEETDVDVSEDILKFTKDAYKTYKRKPKVNWTDESLCESLRSAESKHGASFFRRLLLQYLSRQDMAIKRAKWDLFWFIADPDRALTTNPPIKHPPATSRPSVLPVRGVAAPPTSAASPAAPYSASKREIVFVEQLPELAVKWNQIVKHGEPVKVWSKGSRDHKNLQACMEEDDFVIHQEQILEKTEQILAEAVDDNAWFVNFGWLFKEGNWTKVLNGNYKWVKNGGVEKRSKHKSAADIAIEQLEQEIKDRR